MFFRGLAMVDSSREFYMANLQVTWPPKPTTFLLELQSAEILKFDTH